MKSAEFNAVVITYFSTEFQKEQREGDYTGAYLLLSLYLNASNMCRYWFTASLKDFGSTCPSNMFPVSVMASLIEVPKEPQSSQFS